jgi:hypothetical protein
MARGRVGGMAFGGMALRRPADDDAPARAFFP